MIRFDLTQRSDGSTIASNGERSAAGGDPCRAIARDLVDAGTEDQPWEMWRGTTRCMYGPSLHWLAATAISEGDTGLTRGWWALHPHSEPRPVLAAVVERLRALTPPKPRGRSTKPKEPK